MPTQATIAAHLDLTQPSISRLIASGILPARGSLDECRSAYLRYLRSRVPADDVRSLDEERARLARAQAERQEMMNAGRRTRLIDRDSVASLWQRVVTDAQAELMAIPERVAPRLYGCTRESARAILTAELHDALLSLAKRQAH